MKAVGLSIILLLVAFQLIVAGFVVKSVISTMGTANSRTVTYNF